MQSIASVFCIALFILLLGGCRNPFAPDIEFDNSSLTPFISDLTTRDGVFQNFQYAYTLKDTLIYGELLDPEFIFTYQDYDAGYSVSWGRAEEMRLTSGLFQSADRLDLTWNNIVTSSVSADSSSALIIRGFNLTITFNPTDVIRVDGRVNLQLRKNLVSGKWKIIRWNDESNF